MATETALTRVNVFPSESSYNQNKSSVANTELSLVKVSSNFLEGSVSSVQEPQVIDGRSTSELGFGKMWSWYRVYESGWVEQGGHYERPSDNSGGTFQTITLPIPFKDIYYTVVGTNNENYTGAVEANDALNISNRKTTSFSYSTTYQGGSSGLVYKPIDWYACGYKA